MGSNKTIQTPVIRLLSLLNVYLTQFHDIIILPEMQWNIWQFRGSILIYFIYSAFSLTQEKSFHLVFIMTTLLGICSQMIK